MTLGEHIRILRNAKGLSQPELANLAQIEQSYLSKLENDKSLPSNDIFRQLLSGLSLSLADFLQNLDKQYLDNNLRQIPDIEHWLLKNEQKDVYSQRRYLYIASFLIVMAVTCFYSGFSQVAFTGLKYQYESAGIVLPDEPKNIYANWNRLLDRAQPDFNTVVDARRLEIAKRRNEKIYLSNDYLGEQFIQQVEGGRRFYRFDKEKVIPQQVNAWLQIIGVFLFSTGVMGFILERRLFK
jgi:transcriptional regulator with XRE-family HTH domain